MYTLYSFTQKHRKILLYARQGIFLKTNIAKLLLSTCKISATKIKACQKYLLSLTLARVKYCLWILDAYLNKPTVGDPTKLLYITNQPANLSRNPRKINKEDERFLLHKHESLPPMLDKPEMMSEQGVAMLQFNDEAFVDNALCRALSI